MTAVRPPGSPSFVGVRQLAPLLAGRAGFRLAQYGATVLLLPAWGADSYDAFAAALAATSWLIALTSSGPEKVVLKLVPRAPRTGRDIEAAAVTLAWALPAVCVAVALATVVLAPGAVALTAVAVGAAVAQGGNLLLVGLHRLRGNRAADTANHAALSGVLVALVAAAALGGLRPVGYLVCLMLAFLAGNVVLSARLGVRPSLRIARRPRFTRAVVASTALLGGADVCVYLATAVLFTLLALTGGADGAGVLYVVTLVYSAFVNVLVYVLRVQTPATSLLLAGRGANDGRRRAATWARRSIVLSGAWIVVAAVVLPLTGWATPDNDVALGVTAAVLLLTRTPGIATALFAAFLLENSDALAVRTTAAAAAAGLVAITITGAVLVPLFGAIGVVVAGAALEFTQAAVLVRGATARRAAVTPR